MNSKQSSPQYEAIIVGTGFGGMGAAIELKRQGIKSILMFERANDLGGTWHANSYPGVAVDIASTSYCYSFEPNPTWSRLYAPGVELKKYAVHVAEKYELKQHMQFNTTVNKSTYDEAGKFWTVYPEGEAPITTRVLVLATGFLSQPKKPNIEGMERFAKKIIHTAEWDHDYDLKGKRVAMIGTGATAVQLIPEVAKTVKTMEVYQRTPIWVLPKYNPSIPNWLQKLFKRFPVIQRGFRYVSSTLIETIMVSGVINYKKRTFALKWLESSILKSLNSQVKNKKLVKQLTPDYSFGCKRPTFSNDYYKTFTQDHVELVTDSIDHIEEDAIVTKDGKRREIDVLVLATGFSLWDKGTFPAFDIAGVNGKDLNELWNENNYKSYSAISIPGYPNLISLHCPYAYNGFSYFSTIESQMVHMGRLLQTRDATGKIAFEATKEAQDQFIAEMESKSTNSVFTCGSCETANSYYFNKKGKAILVRMASSTEAFKEAESFPMSNYKFS